MNFYYEKTHGYQLDWSKNNIKKRPSTADEDAVLSSQPSSKGEWCRLVVICPWVGGLLLGVTDQIKIINKNMVIFFVIYQTCSISPFKKHKTKGLIVWGDPWSKGTNQMGTNRTGTHEKGTHETGTHEMGPHETGMRRHITPCPSTFCVSMSMLHAHVYAASPCPCCMTMSELLGHTVVTS